MFGAFSDRNLRAYKVAHVHKACETFTPVLTYFNYICETYVLSSKRWHHQSKVKRFADWHFPLVKAG